MRKVHELKTLPVFFEPIITGEKTFELRLDDNRCFSTGDILHLREWSPKGGYTGRNVKMLVTYLLCGVPWLAPNYVAMSIRRYDCNGC